MKIPDWSDLTIFMHGMPPAPSEPVAEAAEPALLGSNPLPALAPQKPQTHLSRPSRNGRDSSMPQMASQPAPAQITLAPLIEKPSPWTKPLLDLPDALPGPLDLNYIRTQNDLLPLIHQLQEAFVVAVDTEADSLHHYYEKTCLIQIGVHGKSYLIDPLSDLSLPPLVEALQEVPMMLLHGADYDLRLLQRDFGFRPRKVFDTMVAAQILGLDKISYAALVERTTGDTIDKKSQKADWSRRPLTQEMEIYAAGDVHYLPAVARLLAAELEMAQRAQWHRECCEWTVRQIESLRDATPDADSERRWRIKGWHSLQNSPRALAILRELWLWRDEEARKADLPAFKVIHNDILVALAQYHHLSPEERLERNLPEPRLPRNFLSGRRGRPIIEAIERALAMPEEALPTALPTPRTERLPADESLVMAMRKIRDRHAHQLKMDPGILFSSSAIIDLASLRPRDMNEIQQSGILYDWQLQLLGHEILQAVRTTPPSPPRPRRRRKTNNDTPNP